MKDSPLVSIIINNYNYGRFLQEAINSALNQTYTSTEVIVVDDGSTDESRQIIERYGNQIVPVLKENGGQASAFNAGFAASQGEMICFLDADDWFIPGKVAAIATIFAQDPALEWCFHPLWLVNTPAQTMYQDTDEGPLRRCDFRSCLNQGKLPFTPPATSGLCFRRSLLQLILPMPEVIRITSDNYLKLTALVLSQGFYLDQELAVQQIHGKNACAFRANQQQLRAKILVLTAYWMRVKFPSLSGFTHRLLANGLSQCWQIRGLEEQKVIKHYLASVTHRERLEIWTRAFYYRLKFSPRLGLTEPRLTMTS